MTRISGIHSCRVRVCVSELCLSMQSILASLIQSTADGRVKSNITVTDVHTRSKYHTHRQQNVYCKHAPTLSALALPRACAFPRLVHIRRPSRPVAAVLIVSLYGAPRPCQDAGSEDATRRPPPARRSCVTRVGDPGSLVVSSTVVRLDGTGHDFVTAYAQRHRDVWSRR